MDPETGTATGGAPLLDVVGTKEAEISEMNEEAPRPQQDGGEMIAGEAAEAEAAGAESDYHSRPFGDHHDFELRHLPQAMVSAAGGGAVAALGTECALATPPVPLTVLDGDGLPIRDGPPEAKRRRVVSHGQPITSSTSSAAATATPAASNTATTRTVSSSTSDGSISFPQQLRTMLSNESHAHIVSWTPGGDAFIVYAKEQFVRDVMPQYFGKRSKFTSFTRKLNRWGFTRRTSGEDKGSYRHHMFHKNDPHSCRRMTCGVGGRKSKDTARKSKSAAVAVEQRPNEAAVAGVVAATEAEGGDFGGPYGAPSASASSSLHLGLTTPHLTQPHLASHMLLQHAGHQNLGMLDGALTGLSPFSATGFSPVPLTPDILSGLTPGGLSGASPGILLGLSPMTHSNVPAMQAPGLGRIAPCSAPVGLPPPPPLAGARSAVPHDVEADKKGTTGVHTSTGNQPQAAQPESLKKNAQPAAPLAASMSDPFGVGMNAPGVAEKTNGSYAFSGTSMMMGGTMGVPQFLHHHHHHQQQQQYPPPQLTSDNNNTQGTSLSSPGDLSDYNTGELGGTGFTPPQSGASTAIDEGGNESMRLIQQLQRQLDEQKRQILLSSRQISVGNVHEDKSATEVKHATQDNAIQPEGSKPDSFPEMTVKDSTAQVDSLTDNDRTKQLQIEHQSFGDIVRSLKGSSTPTAAQSQTKIALSHVQQQHGDQQTKPSNSTASVDNEAYSGMSIDQLAKEASRVMP